MRVLAVNHTSLVAGAERSLLTLLAALPDEVDVVLACPPGPLADAARDIGVAVTPIRGTTGSFALHPLHTPRALADVARSAAALRRAARDTGADLIHANSVRGALMAAGRRRLVVHVRDILPASAAGRLVRRLMRTVAGDLVFISHAVAEEFGGGRGRARSHVVHNAVDLAAFDPAGVDREQSRRALGLAEGTIALGTLAQITPWKGQDDAIRVLAGLRSQGHDAVLLLAGEAKFTARGTRHDNEAYLRSLLDLTAALGVRDSVRFLGERKDVPALLAALDIVLVPSLEEPFGRVVVEAMAMARPVVSTNVGGPPEIIEDGRTGLLLPPRAPQAWVQAIGALVGDADAAAAMGRAARTDAVRRFGPEDHAAAMLAVYRRAIGAG